MSHPKGTIIKPLEQRIFEKIIKGSDGCWQWMGFTDKAGYARVQQGGRGGTVLYVHRWLYEYYRGRIRKKLELDHLCRNRWCVAPYHLEAVTHQENLRRGGCRYLYGTCKRGHALTDENTYWTKNGKWQCRQCRRDRKRLQNERSRFPRIATPIS